MELKQLNKLSKIFGEINGPQDLEGNKDCLKNVIEEDFNQYLFLSADNVIGIMFKDKTGYNQFISSFKLWYAPRKYDSNDTFKNCNVGIAKYNIHYFKLITSCFFEDIEIRMAEYYPIIFEDNNIKIILAPMVNE